MATQPSTFQPNEQTVVGVTRPQSSAPMYARRAPCRDVRAALSDDSCGRETKRKEFSELVDELLEQWWRERQDRAS